MRIKIKASIGPVFSRERIKFNYEFEGTKEETTEVLDATKTVVLEVTDKVLEVTRKENENEEI